MTDDGQSANAYRPRADVLLRPVDDEHRPWRIACSCGFAHDMGSYGPAYSVAEQHRVGHPDRLKYPAGPLALGGYIAVSREAGENVTAAARALWLAFDAWCEPEWADRKDDPEAWEIWLAGRTGRNASPAFEADVFAWREALRASAMALRLRELLRIRVGRAGSSRARWLCWWRRCRTARYLR